MTRSARGWIAVGIVAAALLGGCAIGPDYQRPSVAKPQTFRGQATAEAASLADAPWWEVFRDPILVDLNRVTKDLPPGRVGERGGDRKSTRLNSSHSQISYAVFCLKKKKKRKD